MKHSISLNPRKYLSIQEQAKLFEILEKYRKTNLRNTTIFMLIVKTGMRPRELLNLTWHDVNLTDSSVYIKTIKRGNDRVIPLGKNLIHRLKSLPRNSEQDRVFQISYQMLWKLWNVYRPCQKNIHSLRHTFAVNLYRKSSFDLLMVQDALGHKKLETTSQYLRLETNIDKLRKVLAK